jgi:uncharacterized membrane protein YqjE
VELAEPSEETNGDNARDDSPTGEPSVSSSLEHLVAGGQGVITKRIDLALLEGQELLSRTLRGAALVGFGMVLAAAAWFAVAACLVLLVTPDANLVVRLALFGLLNGAGAVGLVALGTRGQPEIRARPNGHVSSITGEP